VKQLELGERCKDEAIRPPPHSDALHGAMAGYREARVLGRSGVLVERVAASAALSLRMLAAARSTSQKAAGKLSTTQTLLSNR
jgi:hypothetical protein